MYILSIDSTTKQLSVIISNGTEVISKITKESNRNCMEIIISNIDDVLKRAGISIKEIDVLGVNLGPGDFTGTRIGISIIKTLGWVLGKHAYGINALDIFAVGIASCNQDFINSNIGINIPTVIAPCLDVRKGELYYCLYGVTNGSKEDDDTIANIIIDRKPYIINRISERHLVKADALFDDLTENFKKVIGGADGKMILGGNGIESYGEIFSGFTEDDDKYLLNRNNIFPMPESLNLCVGHYANKITMPEKINPVYVREFVAFGK